MAKDDDLDEFYDKVSGSEVLDKAILDRIVNIVYSICDKNVGKTAKYLKGAAELAQMEKEKLQGKLEDWMNEDWTNEGG